MKSALGYLKSKAFENYLNRHTPDEKFNLGSSQLL